MSCLFNPSKIHKVRVKSCGFTQGYVLDNVLAACSDLQT